MTKPKNIHSSDGIAPALSGAAWLLPCLALMAGACESTGERPADDQRSDLSAAGASGAIALPTPESDGVERRRRTELTDTEPASIVDFVGRALCKFVRHPGYRGHGLYEVTALTAYLEQVGGEEVAATYVELTRLQNFHQAEKKVVARIGGGPASDGNLEAWSVPLVVGERIAVLGVVKPGAWNLGYPTLDPVHVFHERPDGSYTNGALFARRKVDADALGELVAGLADGELNDPCPYDVEPDGIGYRREPQPNVRLPGEDDGSTPSLHTTQPTPDRDVTVIGDAPGATH